jgi:hypothetical protein
MSQMICERQVGYDVACQPFILELVWPVPGTSHFFCVQAGSRVLIYLQDGEGDLFSLNTFCT